MRTPVHAGPYSSEGIRVRRHPDRPASRRVSLAGLGCYAGPTNALGRQVVVQLSEDEARQLCIELGRLFGADTEKSQEGIS